MPWFQYPCQAAGGVLVLEACRFVRASFCIRWVLFGQAPVDSHDALSVFEAMDVVLSWQSYMRLGGVKSGASIHVWVLSLCALVRVPPTTTLDISPRVSIRALCARVEALLVGRVSVGSRQRPPRG